MYVGIYVCMYVYICMYMGGLTRNPYSSLYVYTEIDR